MCLFKRDKKISDNSIVKIITETEPYTHKRYIELATAFDEINAKLGYKKYAINVNYQGNFINIFTYIRKENTNEKE